MIRIHLLHYSAEEHLFCHNEMHGVNIHQLRQASKLGTGAGPDLIMPTVNTAAMHSRFKVHCIGPHRIALGRYNIDTNDKHQNWVVWV